MTNGHGHVIPNPDGLKARCGGPGLCAECARELVAFKQAQEVGPGPSTRAIAAAVEIVSLPAAMDFLAAATARQGWLPARMVEDEATGVVSLARIIDKHMKGGA